MLQPAMSLYGMRKGGDKQRGTARHASGDGGPLPLQHDLCNYPPPSQQNGSCPSTVLSQYAGSFGFYTTRNVVI